MSKATKGGKGPTKSATAPAKGSTKVQTKPSGKRMKP